MRAEFLGELFQYKTALFQQEILSVLVTPLILIYSLPEVKRAPGQGRPVMLCYVLMRLSSVCASRGLPWTDRPTD